MEGEEEEEERKNERRRKNERKNERKEGWGKWSMKHDRYETDERTCDRERGSAYVRTFVRTSSLSGRSRSISREHTID